MLSGKRIQIAAFKAWSHDLHLKKLFKFSNPQILRLARSLMFPYFNPEFKILYLGLNASPLVVPCS